MGAPQPRSHSYCSRLRPVYICPGVYISDLFHHGTCLFNLRNFDFVISRFNTLTYEKHGIKYLGPLLWSTLPKDVMTVSSFKKFKMTLVLRGRLRGAGAPGSNTHLRRDWVIQILAQSQSPADICKMDDLCSGLDRLTLEFFDTMELLQEKREHLNTAIRDGHLNLSKARYSMGNKSVGALQYSHKMDSALYHVDEYVCSNGHSESTFLAFKLQKSLAGKAVETSNASDQAKNVLRRRKPQKSGGLTEKSYEITGIEELSLSEEEKLPLDGLRKSCAQDPIKWFGILVPGCLRTGQNNFQSAIELSCEVVNLEAKLCDIMAKFKALKYHKAKLTLEACKTSKE